MSADLRARARKRLEEAEELGRTPEAVAAAEDAVRLADAAENIDLGFEAREILMEIAVFSGFKDRLLVAFAWCLAQWDQEDPKGFRAMSMLWRYKWVIANMVVFPQITREQVFAALDDFQKRCRAANCNDRAVLNLRISLGISMGDLAAARDAHAQWELTGRDFMSDCEACESDTTCQLYARMGEHEKAIESAGRILAGRLKCAEVPHITHAVLLEPYWKLGKLAEAEASHKKGYRMVRANREFIREQAWHIEYLTRANNLERAAALVRRHLPWAIETSSLERRFIFFRVTRAFLRALIAEGRNSVRFKVPALEKPASPQQLHDWIEPQLLELAQQFDARNGNSWFHSQLESESGLRL